MKDFFVAYWKELAEGFIAILTLCGVLLKKRGKCNPALERIYEQLPLFIVAAEKKYGVGHGDDKKHYVLDVCDSFFYELSGIHLKQSSYFLRLVDKQIEKILSTPSRKDIK